jgi:hypothetical protein
MDRSWTLTYRNRPWTLNDERSGGKRGKGGRYGRAELTREWREYFCQAAHVEHVRPLRHIDVEVLQLCRDRRLPDVGACLPAVKAAIDGLVDAGVIPDDGPKFVHSLLFTPPRTVGYDALSLRVSGPSCSQAEADRREIAEQARLVKQLARR